MSFAPPRCAIVHLGRWLCTRRFREPTFRPSRPTNHSKNTVFRDFPNISRTCIFFLLTLSLSLFYSSLLCFSSLHIVGSLTSKLPLILASTQGKYSPHFEDSAPISRSGRKTQKSHIYHLTDSSFISPGVQLVIYCPGTGPL